jgi:hypothetical protein
MAYKRRGTVARRFGNLGPARRSFIGGAARLALKYGRSRFSSRTQTSQKRTNARPITGESDWSSTYRRRRMPVARRKRWVSFVRRTKHVISSQLAPSFLVRLRDGAVTTTANKQGLYFGHTALYSVLSTSSPDDIGDISAVHDRVLQLSSNSTYSPDRFQITGYMIETQIVNDSPGVAYCDCYYWTCKRDTPPTLTIGGTTYATDVAGLWYYASTAMDDNFPITGSTLDPLDYGNTPFNNNSWARWIRVEKKTRIKLAPGGVTQLEQRSGKNYYFDWDRIRNTGNLRYQTNGIFFVFYGTPDSTNPVAAPVTLRFSTNVNYTYRVMQEASTTGGTTQA